MSWTRGAVVGDRYRLESKVGAGGMGEVWAAEHIGVGTRVAMKTLLRATAKNHEMAARLKREAYFLGRIQSDHVARVFDFIDDERWGLVLVMEFVEGDKLSDVLKQKKQLSVEETIELGADLASALSDLHRVNVIHRDLKPANVILKPVAGGVWRAMIVDFGLSRLLRGEEEGEEAITGITGMHMALGTVEYMAPEQVLNSRDVTPASDLYALGALLYRTVSGRHVFAGMREAQMAHAKITRDPPPLETGRGDRVARGLESVVAHALAKRPVDRFDRADLMLAELSSLRHLARSASADLGESDTEEGLSESRLFEMRQTTRLALSRGDTAGTKAVGAEVTPTSEAATTLRTEGATRQSTVRLPLHTTSPIAALGLAGTEVAEDRGDDDDDEDNTPTHARRGGLAAGGATTAVSARLELPRPQPEALAPVSEVVAPARLVVPAPLVAATAAAALVLGFAAGRVTAPEASAPAPLPEASMADPAAASSAAELPAEAPPAPPAPDPAAAEPPAAALLPGAASAGAPGDVVGRDARASTTHSAAAPSRSVVGEKRPAQRPPAVAAPGPASAATVVPTDTSRPAPRPFDDPYQ